MAKKILILLIIFSSHLKYVELGASNLSLYHIILVGILIVYGIRRSIGEKYPRYVYIDKMQNRTIIALIAYLIINGSINGSLFSAYTYIYLSGFALLLTVTYVLTISEIDIKAVYNTYLTVSVISSVFLLLQTLGGVDIFLFDIIAKLGLADPNESIVHGRELLQRRGNGISLTITDFASHNFLAIFYAYSRIQRVKKVQRIIYSAALFILLWAVWVNSTSAAFLAIGLALVVLYSINNAIKTRMIIVLVTFILILPQLYTFLITASTWGQEYYGSPVVSRLYVWSKALKIFSYSPVIGVGLGKNIQMMPQFDPLFYVNFGSVNISVHSWFFDILSALGIVGIALYLRFLTNIFKQILLINSWDPKDGQILLLSFISYLVLGLFSNVHYMTYEYFLMAGFVYAGFIRCQYEQVVTQDQLLDESAQQILIVHR
jgi:hypothetical protein